MRRRSFLLTLAALRAGGILRPGRSMSATQGGTSIPSENPIWPRPTIVPVPRFTAEVGQPTLSLGGQWKINVNPPTDFWRNEVDPTSWLDVQVPGQADRLGIPLPSDHQYAYKTRFHVPSDFGGKRILLRFEGVTGTTKAWVNAVPLGEHYGGFTVWNRDITPHVSLGQDAWLTLAILDPQPGKSTEYYGGGVIRDVKLMAVPEDHLTRFNIETQLDRNHRDAILKVWVAMAIRAGTRAEVRLAMKDPSGIEVPLKPDMIVLSQEHPELIVDIPVVCPLKWDAEHPHLYALEAHIVQHDRKLESISRSVGFRNVQISGRRLLVNGKEVKIRGAGQFDAGPGRGRSLTPQEAERDVRLYKQANMNFTRPACYPATEAFLEACDRHGLYVEGECPVTFLHGPENNPELAPLFLSQTAEMVEEERSHPSIIMWNLANESNYGVNIRREYDYIKAEDPGRPIIFSWSHRVPPEYPLAYDLYSFHYPSLSDDLGAPGVAPFNGEATRQVPATMPVLADEFAHPPCYDFEELRRDPNVHNFWGQSIKRFWEQMFLTEGCAGGSIWSMISDPAFGTRVYDSGLLDVWRRPKPEYWLAKKAYSPVRVEDKPVANPGTDRPLDLPVKNWFDHTNLKELRVEWKVGSDSGTMAGPDVEPHSLGTLRLPARQWKEGEVMNLRFCGRDNYLIDEYNLPIDPLAVSLPSPQGPAPKLEEHQDHIAVTGRDFSLVFSRQTGLVTGGIYKGTNLLKGGPYLNVLGADLQPWSFGGMRKKSVGSETVIEIVGSYGLLLDPVEVSFEIRVDGTGLITTKYTLDKFPVMPPTTKVVPWYETNAGGFEEVGVFYVLTSDIDALSWRRKGLWSCYPQDHIGREIGIAHRTGIGTTMHRGIAPTWPWPEDEKDFNLYGDDDRGGRGTNDFRSMKENIYFASGIVSGTKSRVRVESDASEAVRLEVIHAKPESDVRLFINNQWNYSALGLGNYMKEPIMVTAGYTNKVRMRLTDHDD